MRLRSLLLAAFAGMQLAPALGAQGSAPAAAPAFSFQIVPARPLPLPQAIALDGQQSPATLQWTGINKEQVVRNVRSASLYPVRPAAAQANGRAVLVVPGGGYVMVAVENEGLAVAQRLAELGYTAFILVYRVKPTPADDEAFAAQIAQSAAARFRQPPSDGGPADDALRFQPAVDDAKSAMRWLRREAQALGIQADRIGCIGFSAGARTCLQLTEQAEPAEMPAHLALIYGGLAAAAPRSPVPPLFVAQAMDDRLFPVTHIDLVNSWRRAGQRSELHLFERGGHGFGLVNLRGTTADGWFDIYQRWLSAQP